MLRTLWVEHYQDNRDAILDELGEATGQIIEGTNKPIIKFTRDDSAGIIYVDDEPAAIVTVDWSEPCLRLTYIQW